MTDASQEFQASCIAAAKFYNGMLRELHSAWSGWVADSCAVPGATEQDQERFRFWARQMAAAWAPENFLWANAGAVKRFFETNGESLTAGYANWRRDAQESNGMVTTVDRGSFGVGRNLAVTPGAVVYRNHLMELLQYAPTTDTVHEVPILFIQPWINKYYILDLSPANSMMAWLRDRGFSVFTVSWKNPGSEMADVGLDDYVFSGALEAVERVRDIAGTSSIHAVGFCIGGTALAVLLAWLSNRAATTSETKHNGFSVAHWTLLASLVDFSNPGEPGLLVDAGTLRFAEALADGPGFLDGAVSELAFRLLRSDGLVWHPAVRRYLFGEGPPKSDVLYWNSDSTRLPKRMLSYYLREFYVNNRLVSGGGMEMRGRRLDLGDISQPLYLLGCVQDHICPWRQALKIREFLNGPVRFALSSEGHIAGILNPPSNKSRRRYWVADVEPGLDPQEWLEARQPLQGSWWSDWAQWLAERCGPQVAAPELGSAENPPLCPAPGEYVLE